VRLKFPSKRSEVERYMNKLGGRDRKVDQYMKDSAIFMPPKMLFLANLQNKAFFDESFHFVPFNGQEHGIVGDIEMSEIGCLEGASSQFDRLQAPLARVPAKGDELHEFFKGCVNVTELQTFQFWENAHRAML